MIKTLHQKAPKLGEIFENLLKDNKHNSLYFARKICLDICPLDIIFTSKLTVFLELRSQFFSEQVMSADKYPSIFSAQNRGYCVYYPSKGFQISRPILEPFDVKFLSLLNLCGR